jgi:hypothetical protein
MKCSFLIWQMMMVTAALVMSGASSAHESAWVDVDGNELGPFLGLGVLETVIVDASGVPRYASVSTGLDSVGAGGLYFSGPSCTGSMAIRPSEQVGQYPGHGYAVIAGLDGTVYEAVGGQVSFNHASVWSGFPGACYTTPGTTNAYTNYIIIEDLADRITFPVHLGFSASPPVLPSVSPAPRLGIVLLLLAVGGFWALRVSNRALSRGSG